MTLLKTGRLSLYSCLPLWLLSACSESAKLTEQDISQLDQQAKEITQQFVGTLLPTLQSAMADGGPVQAIEVCSVRAPEIAAELSQASGWSVRRVSLRPRNESLAQPDSWEREMLNAFDQRQLNGETGAMINASVVTADEYRFMQAQPAMPLCLTCHGQNISQEVRSTLIEHYPNDMATGYTAGQIRGAISLRKMF